MRDAQSEAASYPERTVRIIVPFPAGGATDIVARMVAERLAQIWSRPVVIENVTGAAGATGTALAAKALPDGHTLLVPTGTTMTLLPHQSRLRSGARFRGGVADVLVSERAGGAAPISPRRMSPS